MGNVCVLVCLSLFLMGMLWRMAKFHWLDHSSSYHHNTKHDKCSLCSHYSSRKGCGLTLTGRLLVIAVIMLQKPVLKSFRVVIPLILILLAGDVETNPGPIGK